MKTPWPRPLTRHGFLQPRGVWTIFKNIHVEAQEPAEGTELRPRRPLPPTVTTLPARPGERGHGHSGRSVTPRARSLAAAAATRGAVSAGPSEAVPRHTHKHYPRGGGGRGEPLRSVLLDNLLATQNRACEGQTGR